MRTKILLLSFLLIATSNLKAENSESSVKNKPDSTQQCDHRQQSPGPRHQRTKKKAAQANNLTRIVSQKAKQV